VAEPPALRDFYNCFPKITQYKAYLVFWFKFLLNHTLLKRALRCQTPTLTLLTSQADTGHSSPFFLIRCTVYSIGLKYLSRKKITYFGMLCVFVL